MAKFEKVSRFADMELAAPVRKTANSAGYDFVVAEIRSFLLILPIYLNAFCQKMVK